MPKNIFDIIGATISQIKLIEDYYQIYMSKGIFNIYNPFEIYKNNSIVDKNIIYQLSNSKIIDLIYVDEQFIKIILANEYEIKISIVSEDYRAPEAITIFFNTGEIIAF